MSGGPNGLHPVVNLEERRKCPLHPTKARFTESEADREGRIRSRDTGLNIEGYLCPGCGYWHLTKNSHGTVGKGGQYSVGEFKSPNHPVFSGNAPEDDSETDDEGLPLVPGNHDARVKLARALLETNPEPTSDELCEALGGCTKNTLRKVMGELGYRNTRGRFARWVPGDSAASILRQKREAEGQDLYEAPADEMPDPEPDVDVRLRADIQWPEPEPPAEVWVDLDPSKIGHVAIGDLLATYAAAGFDVRIQIGSHA